MCPYRNKNEKQNVFQWFDIYLYRVNLCYKLKQWSLKKSIMIIKLMVNSLNFENVNYILLR